MDPRRLDRIEHSDPSPEEILSIMQHRWILVKILRTLSYQERRSAMGVFKRNVPKASRHAMMFRARRKIRNLLKFMGPSH